MTNTDLRNLRSRLGITQAGAAQLLGVSKRAITAWEQPPAHQHARTIPEPVARLLQIAEAFPEVRAYLETD